MYAHRYVVPYDKSLSAPEYANETEAAEAMDQNPNAVPRCSGGNTSLTIAMPTGRSMPHPKPSITRQKISSSMVDELPHMKEPAVNTSRDKKYIFL